MRARPPATRVSLLYCYFKPVKNVVGWIHSKGAAVAPV